MTTGYAAWIDYANELSAEIVRLQTAHGAAITELAELQRQLEDAQKNRLTVLAALEKSGEFATQMGVKLARFRAALQEIAAGHDGSVVSIAQAALCWPKKLPTGEEAGDEMRKFRQLVADLASGHLRIGFGGEDPVTQITRYFWHRWDSYGRNMKKGGPYSTAMEAALASVKSAQR